MDRRRFLLTSLAGALAGPVAARAQTRLIPYLIGSLSPTLRGAPSVAMAGPVGAQQRIYRLGFLSPSSAGAGPASRAAFFHKLDELGYRVAYNLVVEYRAAEGRLDRLPALAAELIALKPDILFTSGTQATLAASKATRLIPIVFVAVTDPEGLGIVKSLRRPGTNATGLSNQADEFQIKLLQLLKQAFPAASDVAILTNPLNESEPRMLSTLRRAGRTLGLNLRTIEAKAPEDLVPAFKRLSTKPPDVLYVIGNPLVFMEREKIVALANGQRQPTVYGLPGFVEAGGLMSYSFNLTEQTRAAAVFIDKILKGERPSDLPVEQPTEFQLAINLKTAKTLGVTIPPSLLARAEQVIE